MQARLKGAWAYIKLLNGLRLPPTAVQILLSTLNDMVTIRLFVYVRLHWHGTDAPCQLTSLNTT